MASLKSYVAEKIANDEECVMCVECKLSDGDPGKMCLGLVQRQGDNALFVYENKKTVVTSCKDLNLNHVFPINEDMRIISEPPQTNTSADKAVYLLGFQVSGQTFLFELTQSPDSAKFIEEVKTRKALQSQDAGFGLPSSFVWLDKYSNTMTGGQGSLDVKNGSTWFEDDNPFQNNVFNPLEHMNIEKSGSKISLDNLLQTNSPMVSGFDDDFSTMNIQGSGELPNDHAGLTNSLDAVAQEQLGLKPGTNMADGLKPLTAREKLVEHQLKQRQKEFVKIQSFRVFVGTWNVNGQATTNLDEWLACDKDPPDMYAIGFQELDLSNQAYIFSASARETEWQEAVHRHLHPRARYQKIKSIRLVGVLLIVYIKESLVEHVKLIDTDNVPTGIMGMLGNKGGVAVRFQLHDTSILFINSHLAAHQEEFERRNQDTEDIESGLKFKQFLPPLTVRDHDLVFWIGDLNYRIDQDITKVKELTAKGMFHLLMPHDQLYRQIATHTVYKTYSEGTINFPPTYRYDPGTDNFDTSEKKRNPAWCDRVLWKGSGIKQLVYRSHPALKISDHKPVSSLFDTGIKVVEKERYKHVYEDIMKQLDRLENDYLPQVSLTQREFFFKDVKFEEPQEQVLAIANTGQVPVTYEFINKPDEDSYCKPWLIVTPCTAVIEPGDSIEITLDVCVDQKIAYRFNCGHEHLEDILVLHLHGGKDFFIPISGNYIVSSFGSSIEALVQMHGPIREVPTDKLIDLERPGSLDKVDILAEGTRLFACPKEIFRLVDHIWHYGRHQEDLFQQPGLNAELHEIRDCLDTGTPEHMPGSVHSICEALLLFLKSLAEPVIPYNVYEDCLNSANSYLLCKQMMAQVPDCHRNVFKYLCAFLRQLLEESKFNNLEIKYLAQLFGDVFLRPPPMRMTRNSRNIRRQLGRSEDMKKSAFLYHFLAHAYDE